MAGVHDAGSVHLLGHSDCDGAARRRSRWRYCTFLRKCGDASICGFLSVAGFLGLEGRIDEEIRAIKRFCIDV
jgi:hypothetical protein